MDFLAVAMLKVGIWAGIFFSRNSEILFYSRGTKLICTKPSGQLRVLKGI